MARLRLLIRICVAALLLSLAIRSIPVRAEQFPPLVLTSARLARTVTATWPSVSPVASYQIAVTLDPVAHTLAGSEVVTYYNRTSEAISDLVWHLYLNAFRDAQTTFMRESGGQLVDPSSGLAYPGWVEVDTLTLQPRDGSAADLMPASAVSETLMTTRLPQPLQPGGVLTLSVTFHALLPRVIARTGFSGDYYMVGQWFPKLSVYQEGKGWNAVQLHARSEFFADFGNYDLAVTAPAEHVVAAVGQPAGTESNADGSVTHRFHAEGVIDTAWTSCPRFREAQRSVGSVKVVVLYLPEHEALVPRYLDAAAKALSRYGAWFGGYPYPRLTLVDVPDDAPRAGGMEYPTLVTVGTLDVALPPGLGSDLFAEEVVVHEIGHQWWQSTVATNEGAEPWLDEGLAEYSAARVLERDYQGRPLLQLGPVRLGALDLERMQYLMHPATPMYGAAWEFGGLQYGVAAYYKPAVVLATLERIVGEERWLSVLRTYYLRYRFRHPTTADFLAVVAEVAGPETRQLLEPLVYNGETVNYAVTELQCTPDGQVQRCTAQVERQGGVVLPVELEAVFADGQRLRQTWDTRESTATLVYERTSPVDVVQLDPERKILLDRDWHDNSITRKPQVAPMVRVLSSWFYAVEEFILTVGGLW